MSTRTDLWLRKLPHNRMGLFYPSPNFITAPKRLLGNVILYQKAISIVHRQDRPISRLCGRAKWI